MIDTAPVISVRNLQKRFGDIHVYDDFSLDIQPRKITPIIGPNGSGKSTLFNILSGITSSDDGTHCIRGFDHFQFSYIFQNYRESLLPWRTNYENVALPLELQGKDREYIQKKISELQSMFRFTCDWNGYPYHLSGGEQQVLACMRALATEPKILFIDEPFSALDYENSLKLRDHIQAYYLAYRPTIVLITHDIEEALYLSHRVVIFSKKPTVVSDSIENPLRFPRTIETLSSRQFHDLEMVTLSAFQKTLQP